MRSSVWSITVEQETNSRPRPTLCAGGTGRGRGVIVHEPVAAHLCAARSEMLSRPHSWSTAGWVHMRRATSHHMTPPDAQLRVSDDGFVCLQYQVPRRSPSHHHDVLSPIIMTSLGEQTKLVHINALVSKVKGHNSLQCICLERPEFSRSKSVCGRRSTTATWKRRACC
jgi:hypothetical protein